MTDMIVCGIDPGQKGAAVFLNMDTGGVVEMHPWDCLEAYIESFDRWRPHASFIEKAQAMPKQGVSSMFTYGEHFGMLQGAMITLALRHELVPPRAWTKVMHAGTKTADAKSRSLEAARRWFPQVNLLATERSKVPHEGLIDALLIAEFGRRKLKGKS